MAVRQCYGRKRRDLVRVVQMDNLRGLLSMDKGIVRKKGLDERIDQGMLWWFSHVERMIRDRIDKSLCRRMCW